MTESDSESGANYHVTNCGFPMGRCMSPIGTVRHSPRRAYQQVNGWGRSVSPIGTV